MRTTAPKIQRKQATTMDASPEHNFDASGMKTFAPPPLQLFAGGETEPELMEGASPETAGEGFTAMTPPDGNGFPESPADQQKPESETPGNSDGPIQRVAWDAAAADGTQGLNNQIPAFGGLQNPGQLTPINVAGFTFNGRLYTLPDVPNQASKDKTVVAIAAAIGGLNLPSSGDFLKKKQLEKNVNIQGTVALNTLAGNAKNVYKSGLDPFMVKVGGVYGLANERIDLYYQFGVDSYGYITKIEQNGQTYEMNGERGQDILGSKQQDKLQKGESNDPLYNQYSSAHDTSQPNESIANKANKSTTNDATNFDMTNDPTAVGGDFDTDVGSVFGLEEDHPFVTVNKNRLSERSDRLDAITKLGGEGARWQCVRNHADHLKNSSRFYRSDPNDNTKVLFMTFQTLWGQWGSLFNSKFNIDNNTVAQVIDAQKAKAHLVQGDTKANMTADDYDLGV